MAKTVLNVKTDKEVKDQAQQVAKELGVPLSTVVNAFLKQFIKDRAVLFSLNPNHKTIERYLGSAPRGK